MWRKENSWPYRDSNSDTSVVQPVASRYTDYAIPAPACGVFIQILQVTIWVMQNPPAPQKILCIPHFWLSHAQSTRKSECILACTNCPARYIECNFSGHNCSAVTQRGKQRRPCGTLHEAVDCLVENLPALAQMPTLYRHSRAETRASVPTINTSKEDQKS
jgi:hypothetical protein